MIHFLQHLFFVLGPLPLFCWSASSSSQASQQKTLTTSGAASPAATDSATAATTGSIAVGESGKYQESGAVDLSGAEGVGGSVGTISAGSGSSVVIGDPNADNLISQLAQQFSDSVQSVAASGAAGVAAATGQPQATTGTISYKTLGLIASIVIALGALFALFGGGKK
jgi:hypothetical protein